MHITQILKQQTGPCFSLEILPKPGVSAEENLLRYQKIFEQRPLFVDIPYHAGRSNSGFSGQNNSVLKERPKTKALAEILLNQYRLNPQPHILCHGFSPEETEKVLLNLHETSVRNLLILRGDISENREIKPGQHKFAYQLVKQVRNLNYGIDFREKTLDFKTDFCLGVGGYPEPCDVSFEKSVQYLKQKVNAGADFIITQLFFDNAKFFAFVKACKAAGISVPIIPGISPLVSSKMVEKLPTFLKVSVPEELRKQINSCKSKEELKEVGVNWAVSQAKELYQAGFKNVHFFALSGPEILERVLAEIK